MEGEASNPGTNLPIPGFLASHLINASGPRFRFFAPNVTFRTLQWMNLNPAATLKSGRYRRHENLGQF